MVRNDTLAEWLRRRPAKPMGSPRVGSNPTGVGLHVRACRYLCVGKIGLFRELNPGPTAPEAGIIPLDQTAKCVTHTRFCADAFGLVLLLLTVVLVVVWQRSRVASLAWLGLRMSGFVGRAAGHRVSLVAFGGEWRT